jgi:hypothetical protein
MESGRQNLSEVCDVSMLNILGEINICLFYTSKNNITKIKHMDGKYASIT